MTEAQLATWEAEAWQIRDGVLAEGQSAGAAAVILALIAEVRRLRDALAPCQHNTLCRYESATSRMCPPCRTRHQLAAEAIAPPPA